MMAYMKSKIYIKQEWHHYIDIKKSIQRANHIMFSTITFSSESPRTHFVSFSQHRIPAKHFLDTFPS